MLVCGHLGEWGGLGKGRCGGRRGEGGRRGMGPLLILFCCCLFLVYSYA